MYRCHDKKFGRCDCVHCTFILCVYFTITLHWNYTCAMDLTESACVIKRHMCVVLQLLLWLWLLEHSVMFLFDFCPVVDDFVGTSLYMCVQK